MPHEVLIADQRLPLHDELTVGTWAGGPLLWLRRLASGDAALMSATDATRDGLPLLGGIGVIDWGASARPRDEEPGGGDDDNGEHQAEQAH